jgi:pimeloyl-ACP methyl ester carboxylesterase
MRKPRGAAILLLVAGITCSAAPAQDGSWRDPSPHAVSSVTVAEGVNLEVLDWGGSGINVVLLAGSGSSAHVYDEFAPKLKDCCHVMGLTRRGHGTSSHPPSGYDDQQLANDLYEALIQLKIDRPVLVGHSASGGEMTTLTRQHPDLPGGLVYMDAIGDLEDDPPADTEWLALQQKLPPGVNPSPSCAPLDRSTFEAFRTTWGCRIGFTLPLSELHNLFEDAGGRVGPARMPDWAFRAMGQGQAFRHDYSNIRVPVLALLQYPATTENFLAATKYEPKDDAERQAIDRFIERSRVVFGRWETKLTRQVPNARVVNLGQVGHFLFLTREDEVLRELHAFMAGLRNSQ